MAAFPLEGLKLLLIVLAGVLYIGLNGRIPA